MTSKDFLYSWNRAAALNGPYAASIFGPVVGFGAVQTAAAAKPAGGVSTQQNIENQLAAGNSAFMMSGLTAPDPYTVWCSSPARRVLPLGLTLQATSGMIVDEKVIKNDPVNWWSKPSEAVGTGAYKMTEYIPHQDMKFVAVPTGGAPRSRC